MSETITTKRTGYPSFYSGWRPALGWISTISLSLQFVIFPVIEALFTMFGHPRLMPKIDINPLIGLVTSVVVLGGLRTYEKTRNVAN